MSWANTMCPSAWVTAGPWATSRTVQARAPQRTAIVSPELPTGKVGLKFNFIKTGMFKGTGELYVNGKKVAEGAIEKTHPSVFSLNETFDVGVDNGTPVSNNYKAKDHFPFTGQIDKVVINLTGEDQDKAKEINNTELVD